VRQEAAAEPRNNAELRHDARPHHVLPEVHVDRAEIDCACVFGYLASAGRCSERVGARGRIKKMEEH
jgi:hypothetical protein